MIKGDIIMYFSGNPPTRTGQSLTVVNHKPVSNSTPHKGDKQAECYGTVNGNGRVL